MKLTYKELPNYNFMLLLAMLYVVVGTVCNVLVYRLIYVGGFVLPGGMFIYPLIYVIGDIIAEVYGYKTARAVIWFGLLCNFLFALAVLSALSLPSPEHATINHQYQNVLGNLLKVNLANTTGAILGRFINAYAITKWKVLTNGRFFILRSFSSNAIGEAVQLAVTATIVYYGHIPWDQLKNLFVGDYMIRVVFALVLALPASYIVLFLKRKEKIDIYDNATNFNPFKLALD